MRILIVDDERDAREEMVSLMSGYGECVTAENGTEAVEIFRDALQENDAFDIVCVDIIMPEKDGYQVIREVREIEKIMGVSEENKSKIIVASQLNEARNVKKAFDLGCDAYAGKPIDREKYFVALKKLNILK